MMKVDKKPVIHIALAIDEKYVSPLYVVLTSIFCHNTENRFVVHVITTGVDEAEKNQISAFVKNHGSELCFYNIDQALVKSLPLLPNYPAFTAAVYYRLFFPLLLPSEIEKVIYLDTDTLVIGDLSELYNLNVDQVPVAAAVEMEMEVRSDLGIHQKDEYFNSGVMLINLYQWRQQQVTERAIEFLTKYPEKIKFVDQDALNVVLHQNWKPLNRKFNLMSVDVPRDLPKKKMHYFIKDITILHFNHYKPWSGLCKNRLRFIYYTYISMSPRAAEFKKIQDFSFNKSYLYSFFQIRLVEIYLRFPFLVKIWRNLKF